MPTAPFQKRWNRKQLLFYVYLDSLPDLGEPLNFIFFGPLVVWWQLTQWGRKHWNTQWHAEPRVPAQTFSKPRRCPSPCLIGDVWEGRQCRGTMIALWPSEEVGWDWVGVNTQQDQIKMWQRAKMAAKVFQSQSCDLASPITRRSPVFATVRWHWLMQLMPGWK